MLLIEFSLNKIQLWKPCQANQSFTDFSSNLSKKHVIQKLQSIYVITLAVMKIRKSLNKFTFILKNKFCDAKNPKNSWNNAYMPHKLIYFSSYFFNIPQSYLCSYQVDPYNIKDDDEPDFPKKKVMMIKSLYHTIYMAKRKKDHFIYLMHIIYTKSRQVLIPLNKVGVSVGYEIQKVRNDLTCYTYFQSKKEGVTNPSHIGKDEFTIVAFYNFDHRDRPSLSGKFSNHGTALTLFQVKSEKSPKKTDETQIDYTKVTIKGKIPPKKNSHFLDQKKSSDHQSSKKSLKQKENARFRKLTFHCQGYQKYVFRPS